MYYFWKFALVMLNINTLLLQIPGTSLLWIYHLVQSSIHTVPLWINLRLCLKYYPGKLNRTIIILQPLNTENLSSLKITFLIFLLVYSYWPAKLDSLVAISFTPILSICPGQKTPFFIFCTLSNFDLQKWLHK